MRVTALRGDDVFCPICETSFLTFLPFAVPPDTPRANALCPKCGSLERTRVYWQYLQSKPDFFASPRKILHVAPESVLFRRFKNSGGFEYYPVDKFTEGYRYPVGTINMDIMDIDYPDNYFDFILCSHVLEHVENDMVAITELCRVMKPGGFGILQVPLNLDLPHTFEDKTIVDPQARAEAFGQFDHVRQYGRDYADRLRAGGFSVQIDDFAKRKDGHYRFRHGFGKAEDLFVVSKL